MSRSHNKKRNVGIIYEQIVNYVCKNLLIENKTNASKAIKIIKKHFKPHSQLYKEYKLFKALTTTNNISDQLASSIILEAKKACNHMFDEVALEKEKSSLIKDLNYSLGKGVIFEEKIDKYREYATVQTLLNEWRGKNSDFEKLTEYEIKLHNLLTENKNLNLENNILTENLEFDPLTYKLMKKKFNEKYVSLLNNEQKVLIEAFVADEKQSLTENFSLLKNSCITTLENYMKKCDNRILQEKRSRIISSIKLLNEKDTSKDNLQKFLTISKLKQEIIGE